MTWQQEFIARVQQLCDQGRNQGRG